MDDGLDNTTVVTSEHSYCGALPDRYNSGAVTSSTKSKSPNRGSSCGCISLFRFVFEMLIVLSAVSMVILPFVLNFFGHSNIVIECSADCEVCCFEGLSYSVVLGWHPLCSCFDRCSRDLSMFDVAIVCLFQHASAEFFTNRVLPVDCFCPGLVLDLLLLPNTLEAQC